MPTPFFADLVRELCQEGGTGPLTPTGAVPGHRRFVEAVPADTPFHYAIAGIAQAGQWEVGIGRIDHAGRLVRDSVAASSNGGNPVDFAPGLKTIALTVGADWFAAAEAAGASRDAAIAALSSGLAAKQPVSTLHPVVAGGATADILTVRRDGEWVNFPLAGIAFRDGEGRFPLAGPLTVPDGSAALPAIRFAADEGCGLFRADDSALTMATAGSERLRITAAGLVGLGTDAPAYLLDMAASAAAAGTVQAVMRLRSRSDVANNAVEILLSPRDSGQTRTALGARREGTGAHAALYFAAGGAERLSIDPTGNMTPGADNAQSFGWSSARWAIIYSATGTINTSDAREKIWRGPATGAELRAARRIAGDLGFFQWADAIANKGSDAARYHFGAQAQAVWAIMADEGLIDPIDSDGRPGVTPYAFLCWDDWPAGPNGASGDRFGLRVDQLALFLIAAQEQRLAALEAGA